MGFFSKIANAILAPTLEKGCVEQYVKFLTSGQEFNTEVLSCADVNYGSDALREFAAKYPIGVESDFQGYLDIKSIVFEDQLYKMFIFMHYARAINVCTAVETEEKDAEKLFAFINEVNKKDLLDQIGFAENDGKIYIRVFRQFLNTPHIGDADTMAEGLRDLKKFAEQLAKLEYPGDESWIRWANPQPKEPVENAADFWFNQGDGSCLKNFSRGSQIIEKNTSMETRSMININAFGDVFYAESSPFILKGMISVYTDLPYLTFMQVPITEGDPIVPFINEVSARQFCIEWNSMLHLAPSRVVYYKHESGKISLNLSMTGLYADDTNTRTYVDFLCTLQKATGIMVNSVRK